MPFRRVFGFAKVNSALDIFLPRLCASCEKRLGPLEEIICPECLSSINRPDSYRIASEYKRKFQKENIISGFTSAFLFEEGKAFQKLIHSIKYRGRYQNAFFLGKLSAEKLKEAVLLWKCDFIVPVPLHPVKRAERGYNQSYYIAKGFCREMGIPLKDKLIKRTRFTGTQTALSISERKANIKGAFRLRRERVVWGKRIIILDDVITSGSTVTECGRVLLEGGAQKVYAISAGLVL